MNREIHIDMEETTTALAERLAHDTMFRAICAGDPTAMRRLEQQGSIKIPIDLRRETPLGQRQVESLLRFMVPREIERAMEDAEGDNKVYDDLGEHRILGRAKKVKASRILES
jgi:hypothetical protein